MSFNVKEWLESLVALPTWLLIAVLLGSSVLLFVPAAFQAQVGLGSLPPVIRTWVGVFWLVSAALFAGKLPAGTGHSAVGVVRAIRARRAAITRLHELTPAEKELLAGFLHTSSRSQALEISSGTAITLEQAGIIRRGSNIGIAFQFFPYVINEFAWRYLKRHPDLLNEAAPKRKPSFLRGRT
jgi:hypothetical protein